MRVVKLITLASLLGLAVLHADDIARVLSFGVGSFRGATTIAPGPKGKGYAPS